MAKLNEIKEQRITVKSVGDFAGSLQQIAASRMVSMRKTVLASRRFVDETLTILRELKLEQKKHRREQLKELANLELPVTNKHAIIIVSSNQGLSGSYNVEIFKKIEQIAPQYPDADYFVVGSKGQEFFKKYAKKHDLKYYPYDIDEEVNIELLKPLIRMFNHYDRIYLIYSKYINTTTREVVFLELTIPPLQELEVEKALTEGQFIFEPGIDTLIQNLIEKLRYALFRQQILDSKLSLYTAQMIAMQTASENAKDLLKDLQMEYNKERRHLIDKKIQEVQAGRALWDSEE